MNINFDKTNEQIKSWVAVMAEEGIDLSDLVKVDRVITEEHEIAGVTVQTFIDIHF